MSQLKATLLQSSQDLFATDAGSALPPSAKQLLRALGIVLPQISFAVVLDCVPEQAEDIWTLLIDADHVAVIEVPRSPMIDIAAIQMEIIRCQAYQKRRMSKVNRRTLKAGLALMMERSPHQL